MNRLATERLAAKSKPFSTPTAARISPAHARRRCHRHRPSSARPSRGDCRKNRDRRSVGTAVAQLVRRLCPVWCGTRRRIAFAILIEHAGYGGASAAPAAGEIVSAAAVAGLIRSARGPSERDEHREVTDMDFLRRARNLEARLAGTLDRTVGGLVRPGTREPLEIVLTLSSRRCRRKSRRAAEAAGSFRSTPSRSPSSHRRVMRGHASKLSSPTACRCAIASWRAWLGGLPG